MTNKVFHKTSVALTAALLALVGCESGSNQTEMKPAFAEKVVWDRKAIQIEQLWSDGKWYPRDPLLLDRQFSIQGHAVGDPDFEITFEPVYGSADPSSLRLSRRVTAVCSDQNYRISHVFDSASFPPAWQETIKCANGAWRLTLVDSSSVLRPPVAKQGEILPSGIDGNS